MVVLVRTLTRRAPICRWISFQALTLDRLPAAYAVTVGAERYALQRTLDRADFLHVTGNFRQIDIDQKVGERLIL